ncbi:class I SAM-dependent DNA methyltransferase [Chryseobacterium suipulveris]|uniref:site-specific DNA-methyltransferase (adenine-specific) n=1 Tax=Chryseobacterium suipulveris TaxID=2929800 RepID=A0ABY4BQ28_9FLAO|nr:DNA methyltransferase [Chryseobacterium suipulveris]UOE40322.1 class I SAM-dependent DNA methyltransferase [Chryseobacterium suipulveris]
MTSKEIELNLAKITENLIPEEFIYDFLLAFGISKTSVARLKKGDFNMSKVEGELLYKGKIFFRRGKAGSMKSESENLANDERILKQNPRFIILTDYENLVAKDLKTKVNKEFPIAELSKHFAFFLPLTGAEIYKSTNDNKADRDASYELAKLYDILIEDNAELLHGNSHQLNIFLSRLLFCFFAEDTGIFETEGMFSDSIANHTKENGSDVHLFFTDLFKKLNSKSGDFPAYISDFPYVNGGLFRDDIICPKFSRKSREILLNCGNLNWDEINPDIFGSMIQAVADPEERSDLGMHYTSVPNILKLIKPLFLDELYEEFEKNFNNSNGLQKLIHRMSKIKFFDPACGSGNFLIITYKEIRNLEIKIIKRIIDLIPEGHTIPLQFTAIKLSQFHGIEIKDFAHEMALLSLWLSEHQMNKVFETELMDYGRSEPILPLKESGNIVCGNAARMDWEKVCPRKENDEIYVIGNPPYLGARVQDALQKEDIEINFKKEKGVNNLDYISIWFYKGAKFIEEFNAELAFVSTNSVCQGEQVSLLWPRILNENIEISFAHHSFKWNNNAKKNAGVTVIILGLRNKSTKQKYLYTENIRKEAKNINAYLLDANEETYIFPRTKPLADISEMNFGSMPNDGGNLILNSLEFQKFKEEFGESEAIKKFAGADDFLNGNDRYCIWLDEENYEDYLNNYFIKNRLEAVKEIRNKSSREATRKLAKNFFAFGEVRHKDSDSLIIPRHSSENREYIPIGFLNSETIIGDSALAVYDAQPWLFGVLHSKMHMVWVDAVGGKLETRYRYSAKLCYNTFPFPPITEKDKHHISQYVFAVLDERSKFPEKTMAWLYNPDTMPKALKKAHQDLDLAIERIYRLRPFESDAERLEFLFKMYDEMTKRDTLFAKSKKTKKQQ